MLLHRMVAGHERDFGDELDAIRGKQPHGEARAEMDALHLQFDSLTAKVERGYPLAIGWKPVFVATFRIAAECCDLEVGVAFQKCAELLCETRSVFHALVLRQTFEIEITDCFGEVPGAVIGKEGEYGALGRIAME